MREIVRQVELPVVPERAFDFLVTPSAIRSWWQAARAVVIPRQGGIWAAAWGTDEDRPEYVAVATITVYDPPARLRLGRFQYVARGGGPAFASELETEFRLKAAPGGALLTVRQIGFPDDRLADAFHEACVEGWRVTLEGLLRHARG